tara:strand:+ start:274 stop:1068 length:795 start_codon:yes stop_codon:yes gene_type:complete
MSQTVNTQVAAAPVKKERKPTLSDKYSKFLVSNFNLIKILETKELISAEAVEAAYSEIKLLAPIEEQVEYYEAFLASAKGSKGNPGIKSQMKKFVTQRNKPPKAPRVKKERKPKTETTDAVASTNETKAKKERKPRAKKETKVSDDTQNDVVAQLVEAANSSMSPTNVAEANSTPVEAPDKKTRKPRAKKEEGAETKPKKSKAKKEKVVEAPVQEDEEEISTNEFMVGDTKYLIDSENNLYDINTHEEVGTYDASTSSVLPISA